MASPSADATTLGTTRTRSLFATLSFLRASSPSHARSRTWYYSAQATPPLWRDLDRIQVLGDFPPNGYGHRGCVNALSWSQDGETLISSGDDCRLCVWRPRTGSTLAPSEEPLDSEYFTTSLVLRTGHTGNVFNVQFLPHTDDLRIVTCAGDRQVRLFDLSRSGSADRVCAADKTWEERPESQCCIKTLKCHTGRTKKIVTEDSPDRFLTVSEDHTVRQHDLRTPHICRPDECPQPLLRLPYSLNAIACSPMTPFYFVVAGRSAFGHLFDRRMISRILKYEWGQEIGDDDDESATRCVRRFGRLKRGPRESKRDSHVSGAKMAKTNGHELLLSFMGDAAYLYDIHDPPHDERPRASSVLSPNESPGLSPPPPVRSRRKRRKRSDGTSSPTGPSSPPEEERHGIQPEAEGAGSSAADEWPLVGDHRSEELRNLLADVEVALDDEGDEDYDPDAEDEDDEEEAEEEEESHSYVHEVRNGTVWDMLKTPIVMPRKRFAGMGNVETVKDVNFLGPNDEYVTSGSDDGHFFIWSKHSGDLMGIWEGDSSVVNVVEDRPGHYPMLAVSGIDETVKLFAPTHGPRSFSRTAAAAEIMKGNARPIQRMGSTIDLAFLAAHLRGNRGGDDCRIM